MSEPIIDEWLKPNAAVPVELDTVGILLFEVERLRAENERLRTAVAAERERWQAEVEYLRAALKPFAENVNATFLQTALGHITREHLLEARRALDGEKR